ncbi:hypothetical protein SDC9_188500 [bioreactor metagenome]|uniref:Uncharacterized protein n=1 Tax=bioreactor metagenome TaxID=1076179 RepID=A0A645HQ36_9ZZZZ
MRSHIPNLSPLPTTLFDEPTCRNLYQISIWIMRDFRVLFLHFQKLAQRNTGIFKKTPCIPNYFRIGQFTLANMDHRFRNILNRGILNPHFFQFILDGSIFSLDHMIFNGQFKSNFYNYIFPSAFLFEYRIPITKPAFFTIEFLHLQSFQIQNLTGVKSVLNFSAIRTDILHRRSPHISRNQR